MNTQNTRNSFEINKNGLVLIIGDSIGENAVSSIELAERLQKSAKPGERVMHLNTFEHPMHFGASMRAALGPHAYRDQSTGPVYENSTLGEAHLTDTSSHYAARDGERIATIIINSWEFAAHDYRIREKLVFWILKLMTLDDIRVVVFAQFRGSLPEIGKIQRGGLGKLAGLADQVVDRRVPVEKEKYYVDMTDEERQAHVEKLMRQDAEAQADVLSEGDEILEVTGQGLPMKQLIGSRNSQDGSPGSENGTFTDDSYADAA